MQESLTTQEDYRTRLFFLKTIRTSRFAVQPKALRLSQRSAAYGRMTVGGLMVLNLSSCVQKSDSTTDLLIPVSVAATSATGCRARRVLSRQQDFREQKGQLPEEAESANYLIIFYPKLLSDSGAQPSGTPERTASTHSMA